MINDHIEHLFRNHYGSMLQIATSILHDGAEAEDVVGDVFARLLDDRDNTTKTLAQLPEPKKRAYLLVSVRNKCLDNIAHKQVRERLAQLIPLETSPDLSSIDCLEEQYNALNRFVDTSLTPQTRTVLRLRTDEKLSYKAIASKLKISEAAVYKHLAQATKKLKEHFNSNPNER